jgi:plasmid stabilization system protein ParE
MIVVVAPAAEADLESIGDCIAAHKPARAVTSIRELRGQCLELGEIPEVFARVPRYERHDICRRVFGNYLIFYRIDADRIVVLHILNGAMDYEAVLFSD